LACLFPGPRIIEGAAPGNEQGVKGASSRKKRKIFREMSFPDTGAAAAD